MNVDVAIVGAGFSGLYMLHRVRGLGMTARVFEDAADVGGTWYWNRYPGARCDAESVAYSYGFSEELQQDWRWTERYAGQPEILRYLQHVADRFDLRRDISFETRVEAASFDEAANVWTVRTSSGEVTAQFLVMASGCLSQPYIPEFDSVDEFSGELVHTAHWPAEGLSVGGRRVGVIGTGSSAVQLVPLIAKEAADLVVFQRTPHYSIPLTNWEISDEHDRRFKRRYADFRRQARESGGGAPVAFNPQSALDVPDGPRRAAFEASWSVGGAGRFLSTFSDLLTDPDANELSCQFIRDKISSIVEDEDTARRLMPHSYRLGTKRLCLGTSYFETYNRPNVTLVDGHEHPIERFTADGLIAGGRHHELDVVVLATGFDAMTGALLAVDIRGRNGLTLRDAWQDGPVSYLGAHIAGFPNMFTVTGPGSPSVLSNMVHSIEQHVDWIADLLAYTRGLGAVSVEASPRAQDEWVAHVAEVAEETLFGEATSWYAGTNIPGKPKVFMPYVGGVHRFRAHCDSVAGSGYEPFVFVSRAPAANDAVGDIGVRNAVPSDG